MSGSNLSLTALFLLLIFFPAPPFKLSYGIIVCPKIERQSLLSFKQSLKDPQHLLSSWDGEVDCCKWEGVICNNLTHHVHELRLRGNDPYQYEGLSGKVNPSLLNLKHLRYLDLSQNMFEQKIPSFVGSFTNLEYLNLSHAGFHGSIPSNMGNLSNLHTLCFEGFGKSDSIHMISYETIKSPLYVDSLEWLSRLSKLEYLNMDFVNITKATNWPQVINSLPSLVELHFKYCSLDFITTPSDLNITSLTFLDLSYNFFRSVIPPTWILQLSHLVSLDLNFNYFRGPIPTINNATKLRFIDMSANHFNSSIPDWLYFNKELEYVDLSRNSRLHGTVSNSIENLTSLNYLSLFGNQLSGKTPKEIASLCKIQYLNLSFNKLQGEMSEAFGNMSECFLESVEYLSLGSNQFFGNLTNQFGEFKSLEYLDLSANSLSGAIPSNLGKLKSLENLLLNGNRFTGNLPVGLGQLFNLEELDIARNMLEGVVTESHFANLTKLVSLSASGNHLKASPNWIPPYQLTSIWLGSWNLGAGSQIPSWIEKRNNISQLDLSNTGISGSVPFIRGNKEEEPQVLYLSSNQFSGPLPLIGDSLVELDLSNNSFSGGISHFLCDRTYETYSVRILHLGGNQLSGELPDCWMKWPNLRFLSLDNNNFSGKIPNSIGFLADLESLNLYGNKFSGQIPFSMHNCRKLEKVHIANNDLDGSIPAWIGTSLVWLKILILSSNKLSGNISSEICHLKNLQFLDLSGNRISGVIPRCVYNFTAMATQRNTILAFLGHTPLFYLSYSSYKGAVIDTASIATKGSVLQYGTTLPLITIIDLSNNNFSGAIPKELTSLVELRTLNLFQNHLTGVIPDSIGDMKQLESLDLSRNSLSGQIPNSFTRMSFLNYLNLSYNNLTGRIPESSQILGFNASSFIGNNLCGPPLPWNCSLDGNKNGENEEDGIDIEWFYVLLSLGYAVGFSIVCTTLVLKKSWRDAYFGLLESMWNKLYVYICIKWRRLTKPTGPSS